MKNTTGLYKHQRDNQGGSRRKPPSATPQPKLVPVKQYEYEKARARCEHPMCCYPSCKCAVPFEPGGDIGEKR